MGFITRVEQICDKYDCSPVLNRVNFSLLYKQKSNENQRHSMRIRCVYDGVFFFPLPTRLLRTFYSVNRSSNIGLIRCRTLSLNLLFNKSHKCCKTSFSFSTNQDLNVASVTSGKVLVNVKNLESKVFTILTQVVSDRNS